MTQRYVDDVILIDDATILGGLRFALERTKQVVEPAGAAALAALLYGRIPLRRRRSRRGRALRRQRRGRRGLGELHRRRGAAARPDLRPITTAGGGQPRGRTSTPITRRGFAPYGEVLAAPSGEDREAIVADWTACGRERYGAELKPLPCRCRRGRRSSAFIEAHPNSPQLSVSFDSPWILTVVPGIEPGTKVGRDADVSSAHSFLVPAADRR